LSHWPQAIPNHFDRTITNGFTEWCHTKIRMLERLSYGLRNVEVYTGKMLLGFLPAPVYLHPNLCKEPYLNNTLVTHHLLLPSMHWIRFTVLYGSEAFTLFTCMSVLSSRAKRSKKES